MNAQEQIQTVLRGHGSHVVGALAMWSLRDVVVERSALRAEFERLGLGEAVPRDPSWSACLTRACERVRKGKPGIVFDKVAETVERTVYALSDRSKDEASATVSYQQRVRISVSKSDGALLLEDPLDATLLAVAEAYQEILTYAGTDDLSACLSRAMTGRTHDPLLSAVNLRGEAGGVYFVPAERLATLQALAAWVSSQGASEFSVWEVSGSHQHLAQAARAATAAFSTKLDSLRREVEVFAAKTRSEAGSEDAQTQAQLDASIGLRRERYEQLAAQVETYADVLGAKRNELLASIGEARDALRLAILGA
jgi:hypothetical protein